MINPEITKTNYLFPLSDPTQIGGVRRKAAVLAGQLSFNETQIGRLSIIISELATNLIKHAKSGEILLRPIASSKGMGLEILSLDNGPGMVNWARCMENGYSTAGTLGGGLGAIKRQSHFLDIFSSPGLGTAIYSQIGATEAFSLDSEDPFQVGLVSLPLKGESRCGDGWSVYQKEDKAKVLMVDGLGHGPLAEEPALKAMKVFQKKAALPLLEILQIEHEALKRTRGAAIGLVQIDLLRNVAHFTGVGNISGQIIPSLGHLDYKTIQMVSINGTVGVEIRKTMEFTYQWKRNSILILHTDGLRTQWKINKYPHLLEKHPTLIAAVLYRDFQRGKDDVTVIVLRETRRGRKIHGQENL